MSAKVILEDKKKKMLVFGYGGQSEKVLDKQENAIYIRGKGMKHLLPGIGCNNNHRNNQYRTKGKQTIVLVAATIPINRPHSDLR